MCVVGAVTVSKALCRVDIVFGLSVMFSNVVCFVYVFLRFCPPSLIDHDSPTSFIPGEWRQEIRDGMVPLRKNSSNNYSNDARIVRDDFRKYFI